MHPPRFQSRMIILIAGMALLAAAAGFWRLGVGDSGIAFLPNAPGAEWIIYPKSPGTTLQRAVPLAAVFRDSFTLGTPAADATLTVRAFRSATLFINGQPAGQLGLTNADWKQPVTVEIGRWLRPGSNDIAVTVTNTFGPPALWLKLRAGSWTAGTDEHWEASLAGAAWKNARGASRPPVIGPGSGLYGGERTPASLKRIWPVLAAIGGLSVMLLLGAKRWLRHNATRPDNDPAKPVAVLLVLVLAARIALSLHDLPQLPELTGFDVLSHEQYIQFIQAKHALPLPQDGWEMYQPPLYYLGAAAVLNACGLPVADERSVFVLRAINGVVGLIQCWLAWLCLRLLFPKNPAAQAAGLLVAAFLPPHLYLSQYVTNEPLAGLFTTVAFYFCLRLLSTEGDSLKLYLGAGAGLGAALLTKISALLALPVFLVALALRRLARPGGNGSKGLAGLGVMFLSCLAVGGWHYGRVWAESGHLILGNWQIKAFHWWQEPGFRTGAYFFHFGQALAAPLFSSFHSFADGIYSTLWGDGLASGATGLAFRPPWNYDLMNAGYLLAIGLSVLLVIGFVQALVRVLREPASEWFVVSGLVLVFGFGLVYMSLRVPSYAEVKAFYAFPVLVPFSALVAAGWNQLTGKHSLLRDAGWVGLLAWALTVYAAFWIRSDNPETWRARGQAQLRRLDLANAADSFTRTLQLNPQDAEAHYELAQVLGREGDATGAVRQCREALRLRPDFPEALNRLALILATGADTTAEDKTQAVRFARRACELTDYGTANYLATRAVTWAAAEQCEEAIATAQQAGAVATATGGEVLRQQTREFLVNSFNLLAWRLATSPDASLRNGPRAVQLAEYAAGLNRATEAASLTVLGAAYAEAGRFAEAIAAAQKASALAGKAGEQDIFQRNQELLERYRRHEAYHEPPAPESGRPAN